MMEMLVLVPQHQEQNYPFVGDVSATGGLSAAAVDGNSYFGGNVGIGTTAPHVALDVAGTIRMQDSLRANNGSNKLILYANSAKTELHAGGTDGIVFKDSGNNEHIRMNGSGCLGIGTAAPTEALTVAGNISALGTILTPTMSAARNTYFANCVGIGTTAPGAALDVWATPNTNSLFLRDNSDGEYTHNFWVDSAGNGHTYMYAEGNSLKNVFNTAGSSYFSGCLGVGTTTPGAKLINCRRRKCYRWS